jgi:hypothetical protein
MCLMAQFELIKIFERNVQCWAKKISDKNFSEYAPQYRSFWSQFTARFESTPCWKTSVRLNGRLKCPTVSLFMLLQGSFSVRACGGFAKHQSCVCMETVPFEISGSLWRSCKWKDFRNIQTWKHENSDIRDHTSLWLPRRRAFTWVLVCTVPVNADFRATGFEAT